MSGRSGVWQTTKDDGLPHLHSERGAALLIVFLFAAIVAIMLYREMPVTAFEARRQQEQLLVDRGHEYVRAIQLYYRRFKPRYPPSLDALEDTNHMRFLRHRFKDPFTGKDDWRLVHTNGLTLTDSKVNRLKTGANGQNQNGNQNGNQSVGSSSSQWFTKSDSGFSSDSSSTQTSSKDQPEVVVPPIRARPPAIRANGSVGALSTEDNPEASPPDADQNGGDLNAQLQASLQGEQNATGSNAQASTQPGGAQQTGSQQSGAAGAPNPMQMVRNMLSGESPLQPQQMGSPAGTAQGGGIAGVASKAGGQTIKVINDQTDYSLWEFVYDPTKDKSGTQPVAGGMQQPQSGNGTSPASTSASPFATTTGSTGMQPAEGNPSEGTTVGNNGPAVRMNPQ